MEFNTIAVSDGVTMGVDGHARLARQPRGDRRLDRARRPQPPLRRPGLPGRLRQDDPGRGDGPGPPRPARPRASTTARSRPGTFHGRDVTIQDVFEAIGAYVAGTMIGRGAARARVRRLPRRRRLRRPVHRQHDGDGARVPGHQPGRAERHPGRSTRQGRGGPRGRPARHAARARRRAARADHHPRGDRERGRRRSPPPAARPTASCTSWPSPARPASPFTLDDFDGDRRAHADRRRASSPAASTWPPTSTRPAASASSRASCRSAT